MRPRGRGRGQPERRRCARRAPERAAASTTIARSAACLKRGTPYAIAHERDTSSSGESSTSSAARGSVARAAPAVDRERQQEEVDRRHRPLPPSRPGPRRTRPGGAAATGSRCAAPAPAPPRAAGRRARACGRGPPRARWPPARPHRTCCAPRCSRSASRRGRGRGRWRRSWRRPARCCRCARSDVGRSNAPRCGRSMAPQRARTRRVRPPAAQRAPARRPRGARAEERAARAVPGPRCG